MAAPRSGQLDQISEAIGELKGSVKSIERYMHEREHGLNNLSQKIDGLAVKLSADIAAVEARMDSRLLALEKSAAGDERARSIMTVVLQSPLIAWLFAIAVIVYEAVRGRHS
jgi:hypothetical protein